MKMKGGGRRKSWDAITEEDLANDNTPNDSSSSAPPHLLLDVQQQQPHDTQHPVLPVPHLEAQPQGDADDDVVDDEDDENDDADENTERPKLDEGFYEIEAVRRKRVRKVLLFPTTITATLITLSFCFVTFRFLNTSFPYLIKWWFRSMDK